MSQTKPWMKFYPADWRADPALRMCSLAARGLWVEMLSIMHEAEPYGYLLVNGRPVTDAQLAVMAAALPDQVPGLLDELESAGVFSRSRKGAIFSRRMVRDEKKSEEGRKSVEKRWKKPISENSQDTEIADEIDTPNRPPTRDPFTKRPEARVLDISSLRSDSPPIAPPSSPTGEIAEAFDAWNNLATELGLPKAQVLNPRRTTALKARLAEIGGLEGWKIALAKVRDSPFLRGETGKDGWKADFDFLLQQKSLTKLMEGSYDRNSSPNRQIAAPRSAPRSSFDAALDLLSQDPRLAQRRVHD